MYPWVAPGHAAELDDELMIDCAVYGKRNVKRAVDWSQVLEEKTHELGGIKTLISRNHYTRERFWEIYDRERWQAAKAELDPHGLFRDLYENLRAKAGRARHGVHAAAGPVPGRTASESAGRP